MGSLYGFEILSELPLRRLNAAAGTRGELSIERAKRSLRTPDEVAPAGTLETEDGRRWYASYELDDGSCLLEMPPTGSFLLEPGGRIVVEARTEDEELLEHRIASSAVCTLLSMRDDLVLHAAAVEADGRAIVFCGPSQRGKSTLARALGEAGHPLLGEDGIAIELGGEEALAYPGARGVRVRDPNRPGQGRAALLQDPGPGEPDPCPVAAVVLLDKRGPQFVAEPLAPARALALLTPNLVHSGSRKAIANAFQRLAALLGSIPALGVSLPDDLAALPEAAQIFLDATADRS